MPGVSRAQKAEAKYNVVLDFPDYGLHSAAVSGNLGLVKYALDHGQPVNSALDGVLPLHAACSGGNDLVVRLLIEHGADVNAPRLPRRYSNDKHRNTVAQLVISGASGSTPLHFAAAHGHTNVVLTLLLHGAHPDRPDKHGVTPEMLARQNGFPACADVLREWCHNKDKDLREREALGSYYPEDQTYREKESHPYCGSLDCRECATRKRIRMKRSIDNVIHILRHSSSHSSNLATPPHSAGLVTSNSNEPPSPLERSTGEYSFYNTPDSTVVDDLPPRRPSLPHVLEIPHNAVPTSHRSRRPSNLSTSSTRRPRSAGNDAESCSTKVKGKISLLNLFKKGNDTPDSISSYNSSSSAVTSASTSPATQQLSALAMTSLTSRSTDMLSSTLQEQTPSAALAQQSTLQQRLLSNANGASPLHLEAPALHHTRSHDSLRAQASLQTSEAVSKGSSPARPGILRAHGRSSSGQSADGSLARSGSTRQSHGRSLRFDSTSSEAPSRRSDSQLHARPHSRDSRSGSFRSRSPGGSLFGLRLEAEPEALTTSPQPMHAEERQHDIQEVNEDVLEKEDEEEEYGQPVQPQVGMGELKTRMSDLHLRDEANLSTVPEASDSNKLEHVFECPFSINHPPPEVDAPHSPASDMRMRGDSLSSMVTDTSGGPPSSYVPTPALEQCSLPGPAIASPSSTPTELPPTIDITPEKHRRDEVVTPLSRRRVPKTPLDIDIRNISSYAQAEALVQRAQQRIFDLDNNGDEFDEESKTLGLGEGHTPLSARLAAYGESLAIERKFRAEQERRKSLISQSSSDSRYSPSENSTLNVHGAPGAAGLNRQLSLQEREGRGGRSFDEQRPHSSGEPSASLTRDVFLSANRSRSNVLSTSNPENSGRLYAASVSSHSLISPPSAHMKMRSETLPAGIRSPIPRSRTPDPDMTLSRGASFGAPLTRFPTCPAEDSLHELVPRKSSLSNQARQAARAQKLARMGFLSGGESWRDTSEFSRTHKPHRFGGIKTLVQSLTGKT